MADRSKIEWTDATWNPIRGCSVVSEGCRNCYAMNVAARFSGKDPDGKDLPYAGLAYHNESGAHWTGEVKLIEAHLEDPLRWKRPRRIFVNSMSDLFHESIPDAWIDRIFAVMYQARQHTFQILTKRPDRMKAWFLGSPWYQNLGHIYFGVSCEDMKAYKSRVPYLAVIPGVTRFVSFEPLLSDVGDLMLDGIFGGAFQWAIVGGESGPCARPMHPDWVLSLRDQCVAAGVPFFFKQWGEYLLGHRGDCDHISSDGAQGPARLLPRVDIWRCNVCRVLHSNGHDFARVGKKAAGRLLDGREWNEYPDSQAKNLYIEV